MRMIIFALLLAISYAQTAGAAAVAAAGDLTKLADSIGATIDEASAKEAHENWKKQSDAREQLMNQLQTEVDSVKAHVNQITSHRSVFAKSEDKKNEVDTLVEGESINYIAAELMELKKKIDAQIGERDALIQKYVPKLKEAMQKREAEMNKYWEDKAAEWKEDIQKMHEQLAETRELNKKALEAKQKEIEVQQTKDKEKLDETLQAHADDHKKIEAEMAAENTKHQDQVKTLNANQREKDDKYKDELKGLTDKNAEMFTDQQSKMQEVNSENEEKVKGVETKYTGEVEAMNGKLAKEKTAEDDKIRELTDETHVLQKQEIRADADKVKTLAEMGKQNSDWKQKERESISQKMAELEAKNKQETEDALKAQADQAATALENAKSQIAQRMKNAEEAANTQRERARDKEKSLKEQVTQAQKDTDAANNQLREVENQLDEVRNAAASLPTPNTLESAVASIQSSVPYFEGLNWTYVSVLVTVNVILAGFALFYYFEGQKVRNVYSNLMDEIY